MVLLLVHTLVEVTGESHPLSSLIGCKRAALLLISIHPSITFCCPLAYLSLIVMFHTSPPMLPNMPGTTSLFGTEKFADGPSN